MIVELKRSYSEINMALFENLLTNLNWNSVTELQNTEQALDKFNDIWSTYLNLAFRLNVSSLIDVFIK